MLFRLWAAATATARVVLRWLLLVCGCGVCWNDCVASGYDIASSLPLQVALYWNAIYAVFYVLFGGIVCVYKVSSLPKCERVPR